MSETLNEKPSNEIENRLSKYLEDSATVGSKTKTWPRVFCCNSSRSLYCPECFKLLIPQEEWPTVIQEKRLRLPFQLDILMDEKERRTAATGIHLAVIAQAIRKESSSSPEEKKQGDPSVSSPDVPDVRFFDLKRVPLPSYDGGQESTTNAHENCHEQQQGTYVLFPDEESVSIREVAPHIRKLIVLEMKWTRQSMLQKEYYDKSEFLQKLPKVHLDGPPRKSHLWRWHNSGEGMVSTIEAVYCAAMECSSEQVATSNKKGNHSNTNSAGLRSWSDHDRDDLIHWLWLFALQHSVVHRKSKEQNRPSPFSDEGKSQRRHLRTLQRCPKQNKQEKLNPLVDNKNPQFLNATSNRC